MFNQEVCGDKDNAAKMFNHGEQVSEHKSNIQEKIGYEAEENIVKDMKAEVVKDVKSSKTTIVSKDEAMQMAQATKDKADLVTQRGREMSAAGQEKTGEMMQKIGEKMKEVALGSKEVMKQTFGMLEADADRQQEN